MPLLTWKEITFETVVITMRMVSPAQGRFPQEPYSLQRPTHRCQSHGFPICQVWDYGGEGIVFGLKDICVIHHRKLSLPRGEPFHASFNQESCHTMLWFGRIWICLGIHNQGVSIGTWRKAWHILATSLFYHWWSRTWCHWVRSSLCVSQQWSKM